LVEWITRNRRRLANIALVRFFPSLP